MLHPQRKVKPMKKWACFLVVVVFMFTSTVWSQEPIKLGFVYLLSGRVAYFGMIAKQGAELAIDELNRAGGINGRKVVATFVDSQGKPEVAGKAVKKFVEQDKVDAVLGIISSGVAAAVAPEMKKLKVPLIITVAMTPSVTGKLCNRYTFRVGWNIDYNAKSAAQLAAAEKARKWTTIGPNYRFGYESWELFEKYLKPLQPNVVFAPKAETIFESMATTDWTPHIKKIIDSGADGVLVSLYGGNAIDFVRQGNEMGFFDGSRKIFFTIASTMEVFVGLGSEMPAGLWVGSGYWFQATSNPANKVFVDAYQKRYRTPPSWVSEGSYSGVMAYAKAAEKAGAVDKEKVVEALEGLTFEGPAGKFTIRPDNHQAIRDTFWGKTSGKYGFAGKRRLLFRLLDPIRTFTAEEMGFVDDDTGCNMQ
jgi:branched-chain amino acid transport system substrate-binding protein